MFSGLFRCTKENICVHASEVCDGIVHCQQSYEDEASCKVACPEFCLCSNTVALCENIILLNGIASDTSIIGLKLLCQDSVNYPLQLNMFNHLNFIDFSACGIHQLKMQQTSNAETDTTFLDFSGNSIEDILPFSFKHWAQLTFLLMQNNHVKRLRSFSLTGIKHLQVMNLSKNVVNTIEKHSFKYIASVHVLDLSLNKLNYIVKHSVDEIDTIGILLLAGNVFENVQVVNFIHFVKIDNTGFCCIMNTKYCSSDSTSSPPVHRVLSHKNYSFIRNENNYSFNAKENSLGDTHCRYLIKYLTVRYLLWGMLALCILVNALFLFVRIVKQNTSELTIFNVNTFLFNGLKCLFLLGLLTFDSRYKLTFSFSYLQWRKSMLCLLLGNMYFLSSK